MSQKKFFIYLILFSLLPQKGQSAFKPAPRLDLEQNSSTSNIKKEHSPTIRVLLQKGLEQLTISGRDIIFKNSKKKFQSNNQRNTIKFNCDSGDNNTAQIQSRQLFASLTSPTGIIKINDNQYRGDVSILADYKLKKCDVVNELPLEDYVASVLPREMNKNWPLEALKAQAVAARSYAYYKIKGSHKTENLYDLENSEKHQVSGTLFDIDQVTRKATKETYGEILTDHAGNPVPVFFHASCGGRTWVPDQVWSNSVSGYSSRPCICHQRPDQAWKRVIEWKDLVGFLKWNKDKQKIYFDEIQTVSSANVKTGPDNARYPSLNLFYKEKGATITKSMFRRFFGREKVPSNNFKVTKMSKGLALEGSGRGHGVGLCQLGALDFARKGWSYVKILEHYFPGHTLKRIFK